MSGYYNYLASFIAVYQKRSISGAAESLDISQPAVTRHIKRLEKELSQILFKRTTRKLEATAVADQLYIEIGPAFNQLNNSINSFVNGDTVITIGSSSDVITACILPRIAKIIEKRIQVKLSSENYNVQELRNGKFDFILSSTLFLSEEDISIKPCYKDHTIPVANKKLFTEISKMYKNSSLEETIMKTPWIAFSENKYYLDQVLSALVDGQEPPPVVPKLIIHDVLTAIYAATNGLGVVCLPEVLWRKLIQEGTLFQLPMCKEPVALQAYLCWKEGSLWHPAKKFVHQCLSDVGTKNIDSYFGL